ncbi:MAG TPA: AmmeMemoRadiSam system radical SAM enzyme [Anaerolineales bacterium]|nr:AmmeMemoRadiSam system radical SAM enzyme [Anaerolineales bacterium]
MTTLGRILDAHTAEGRLYRRRDDGAVECYACGHRCLIRPGRRGICQVRFNDGGTLRVPWGYVGALQCDPVEKKPFFHVLPGSDALTFGMLGCDFHCPYCQNWVTSQAMRDPESEAAIQAFRPLTPEALVEHGRRMGARLVVSSYNEPLITSEWAGAVFEKARQAGMVCAYVSNGNATPEVLEYLRPWVTAYKIDLKTMNDKAYRKLGGVRDHVLETIRRTHEIGFWVEVVTLVIPGFNDSTDELMEAARFLVAVSPDIPWHVTAFHPDYRMIDPPSTSTATLMRAAEIGQEAGLRHVYAGNLPGRVGAYEHTFCPACGRPVIERLGYALLAYRLTSQGNCQHCGAHVPGVWTQTPGDVRVGGAADLYERVPRPVR